MQKPYTPKLMKQRGIPNWSEKSIPCPEELGIVFKASAVEQEAEQQGKAEDRGEENVHKEVVQRSHGLIGGAYLNGDVVRKQTEGLVKEAVNEDAQHTNGKTCAVKVVAAVHGGGSGEQSGDQEACNHAEGQR